MNYRHIYHAGNFADVIKHIILMQILERLKIKEAPFFVLDTHAGIGVYTLQSEQAQKTLEAISGVGKIFGQTLKHPVLQEYCKLVQHYNADERLLCYPGSPAIISHMIRPQDRFLANELHPDDHKTLKRVSAQLPMPFKILHMDAYQALKANVPPKERRGLVLIDPPFEQKDEFSVLIEKLKDGLQRWQTGTYMIWFPLKKHFPVEEFYREIVGLQMPKTWLVECWVGDPKRQEQFNGCGVVVFNTPWQLDTVLADAFKELQPYLCPRNAPGIRQRWLVA